MADSRQNVPSVAANRNTQPAPTAIPHVEPPQPAVERQAHVGGGECGNNVPGPAVRDVGHAPLDRSPSAGTMSAPSSLEDLGTAGNEQGSFYFNKILLNIGMDGWIIQNFTSLSPIFQSSQDDGRVIVKGC